MCANNSVVKTPLSCSILSLLTALKGSISEFDLFSWMSTLKNKKVRIPTSPTPSNQNPAQALSRLVRAAPVNVQVIIRVWWEVGEVYKKDG